MYSFFRVNKKCLLCFWVCVPLTVLKICWAYNGCSFSIMAFTLGYNGPEMMLIIILKASIFVDLTLMLPTLNSEAGCSIIDLKNRYSSLVKVPFEKKPCTISFFDKLATLDLFGICSCLLLFFFILYFCFFKNSFDVFTPGLVLVCKLGICSELKVIRPCILWDPFLADVPKIVRGRCKFWLLLGLDTWSVVRNKIQGCCLWVSNEYENLALSN